MPNVVVVVTFTGRAGDQRKLRAARKRGLDWVIGQPRSVVVSIRKIAALASSADKSSHIARLPAASKASLLLKLRAKWAMVCFGFNGRLSPRSARRRRTRLKHSSNGVFRRMTAEETPSPESWSSNAPTLP